MVQKKLYNRFSNFYKKVWKQLLFFFIMKLEGSAWKQPGYPSDLLLMNTQNSYGALKTTLGICYTDNDNMNNDDVNNVDNDNVNVKYNFLTISFHYILFMG